MIKKISILTLLLTTYGQLHAKLDCFDVTSPSCFTSSAKVVPQNVEQFLKMRGELAKEPYGAAELLLLAFLARQKNPTEGEKMLVLALSEDQVIKSKRGVYKGYKVRRSSYYYIDQIDQHPYCINAHVAGTSTSGGYKTQDKVRFVFRRQTKYVPNKSSGKYKVFACSSATDSCRPISLKKNKKGLWKVYGFSSIAVGCKKPALNGPSAADDL